MQKHHETALFSDTNLKCIRKISKVPFSRKGEETEHDGKKAVPLLIRIKASLRYVLSCELPKPPKKSLDIT